MIPVAAIAAASPADVRNLMGCLKAEAYSTAADRSIEMFRANEG
jgi:hypothetical protein